MDLEMVRIAAAGRPDIVVTDGVLAPGHLGASWRMADCYVSLHRSEGLGLTMAESMVLGKPVIATAYSGNLDFMTEENSFLVPYSWTEVPRGAGPYPAGARWAEPDSGGGCVTDARRRRRPRRGVKWPQGSKRHCRAPRH